MVEDYYNFIQYIFDFIMECELPGQEIIGPLSIALGSAGFCAYYRKELHKYFTERRQRRTEQKPNLENSIDFDTKTQFADIIKRPTRVSGIACEAVQVTPNDFHVDDKWFEDTRMAPAVTSFTTTNCNLMQEIHHAATISRETEQAERCIKLLMKHPEAVNIPREPYGFTPFLTACWAGSLPLVRYMLSNGANMEMRTNDGDTPMYLAVRALLETEERPRFTLLQLLLEAGGSVNVVNHSGYSPLHLAAANGSKRLVKWLVEKGASPFQRNSQGYRPIDLANLGGHVKVIPLLTVTVSSNKECKTDSDSSIISSSSASPFRQLPHHRQLKRAMSSQFVHPMVKIPRLSCSTHPRCTIQSDTDTSKLQQLRDPRLNRSLQSESSSVSSRRSRSRSRRKRAAQRKCNYASM